MSWKLKKKAREVLEKERGTVIKDRGGRVSVCLVYPNTYFLGMSNLGFQTIYRLFNNVDYCVCERGFLPENDDLKEFERTETPLFSIETQTPLNRFDVIAFSISFEEDFLNIPKILEMGNIPLFSKERVDAHPLVMAGGVAVSLNPEPAADFFDLFMIGEGEELVGSFIDLYKRLKEKNASKKESLKELADLQGIYVPSFYEFTFDGPKVKEIKPLKGIKPRVKAIKNFDIDRAPMPESLVLTTDTEFKDTTLMEIERGCGRQCRFCAAGFLYLPPRFRSTESIKQGIKRGMESSGKVGLVGAAVSEYPDLKDVLKTGIEAKGEITLSSLRADVLDEELLTLLKKSGYKTLTVAPEAGTERMRRVVNKSITDEELMEAVRLIRKAGFRKLKLYFMVGLPIETDEDAEAIAELSKKIKELLKGGEVALSINPFVPKPFTPFQRHGFEDTAVIERRLSIIKNILSKIPSIKVKTMSAREAFTQAYLSRADRRAGRFIAQAHETNLKKALKAADPKPEESVYRKRDKDEILPWDVLDHGLEKEYLWREYQRGLDGELTPPCDVGRCTRCGVC